MWLIGLLLAGVYSELVLPKESGKTPNIAPTMWPILWKGMVRIPCGRHAIHVHHWMISGALYAFIPMPSLVVGFAFGMTLHGLRYKDCFCVIEGNPWADTVEIGSRS